VKPINDNETQVLIEEHIRERGWDIIDFTNTRQGNIPSLSYTKARCGQNRLFN